MTTSGTVEQHKALVAAVIALGAQIRTPEDVAYAVEHICDVLATKQFPPDLAPTLNATLPAEFKELVDKYHNANGFVLEKLIEYGGFDFAYDEVDNGQNESEWHIRSLMYKGCDQVDREMAVQRKHVVRDDGTSANIPCIPGNEYTDLFYSMEQRQHLFRDRSNAIFRQIAGQLEIDIAGRQTVHNRHKRLPAKDGRHKHDRGHGVFLDQLKILREAISEKLQQRN